MRRQYSQLGVYLSIDHVTPPVVPANGTATVACPDDAVAPIPYSTPAGYSYIGTLGGHNYYLSDAGTDWVSAQAAAVLAGGHLATISSAAENNLVAAVVPGAGGFAWIGLSDAAVEGTYVWVDGSPFGEFTQWNPGEPNNNGDEDYVHMYGQGNWNDLDPGDLFRYIIEIDAPALPAVTDVCGTPIIPTGPITGGTYEECEGTITYSYVYTDCSGLFSNWTYTYTIEVEDFSMPANGSSTIACPALAVQPTPPVVTDNCGEYSDTDRTDNRRNVYQLRRNHYVYLELCRLRRQ